MLQRPGLAGTAALPPGVPGPGAAPEPGADRRIVALDGLRGLMTLLVIVSHYFGELPHGVPGLTLGWLAVDMFFVLSGLLIGKLILEKRRHANFFAVFYVRRFCRIIPVYLVTVLAISLAMSVIGQPWMDAADPFPLWSYLTFTQVFFMVSTGTIGAHWLAPTWTLAVEEHFYLFAPALIVFAPRRWLAPLLLAVAALALGLRVAIYYFGVGSPMMALSLLPGRADILALGLLAAVLLKTEGVPWRRLIPWMRVAPPVALAAVLLAWLASADLFYTLGPLLIAAGCAAYLLCIVQGTPEARRYESRALQFLGNNGYCLYLTHLPILGLTHGLILGAQPDLATPSQWLVTAATLPVCLLVGWGMTRLIEEPLTRYGRTWRWGAQSKRRATAG